MDGIGAMLASLTAFRYGNRPLMENCVAAMDQDGFPTDGFLPSFDQTWRGVDTSAEAANRRARERSADG